MHYYWGRGHRYDGVNIMGPVIMGSDGYRIKKEYFDITLKFDSVRFMLMRLQIILKSKQ